MRKEEFVEICLRAYPLHPSALVALPHLFHRFAQNERSLFSYLSSHEPKGFQEFLRTRPLSTRAPCFIRLPELFDYFTANFGSGLFRQPQARRWLEAANVLDRKDDLADSQARLVKTVGSRPFREKAMNVLEAITMRRSVRAYSPQPVDALRMQRMKQALRSAPSACNLQPWHFIFVTDADLRQQVAQAANGQAWMAGAPVIVVACGLSEKAYKHMGGHSSSVDVDVAIALDHLTLAAVAERLGTCWIGAFDEAAVKLLLHVPRTVKVVAMTPLGYRYVPGQWREEQPQRQREDEPRRDGR